MKILVLNAGSSSIKYCLFDMQNQRMIFNGIVERIGEAMGTHRYQSGEQALQGEELPIANHQQALAALFGALSDSGVSVEDIDCIGHRVVHGGELFRHPALVTAEVIEQIAGMVPLAPLHNPANLLGIQEAMRQVIDIPQVAVFDTAFHQTLPDYAYRYALPNALYSEHNVRRYGFHGTSHNYVAKLAAEIIGKALAESNLITLHLGNGASVTAIENGLSIDTSMGMTPLEGLMMGTRCGDIDPALPLYLSRTLGMTLDEIDKLMNKQSGLKGICGENDMRTIHAMAEAGDAKAGLALRMYVYRLKKYIGAYAAVLGKVDALVFTGGIGEHDDWIRRECCNGLSILGLALDDSKNAQPSVPCGAIHADTSAVKILVIKTHEELEIAIQAQACLNS
jgi:acetate kinase